MAALIVVFYHLSMVVTSMSTADAAAGQSAVTFSLTWWANYTPLKFFTAGPQVVVVFFILSGFVLTLAPLNKRNFDWLSYVPRRFVRLYVPIVGALLLAAAIITFVPQPHPSVTNGWVNLGYHPLITPRVLFEDATVLFGAPFTINGPMWSLVPEVLFSLLLPVFVAIILWFRRLWWLVLILSIVEYSGQNFFYPDYLGYLATFMIGCALAAGLDDIRRVASRIDAMKYRTVVWSLLLIVAIVLVPFDRTLRALVAPGMVSGALGLACSSTGATILVVCAISWNRAQAALDSRPMSWLGRTSFSLYLVHMPIVLAVTFLVGDDHFPLVVLIALPACLLMAQVFHFLVERPSIRLSRAVGRRMSTKLDKLIEPVHSVG